MLKTKRYINVCICGALILLSLSGACSNLYFYSVGGKGVNIGTYIVFSVCLLGFLVGAINLKTILSARMGKILLLLLAVGMVLSFYFTLCFGKDKVLAIKASLSFFFIPFVSVGAYALTGRDGGPFARLLLFLGILFASIGILQFILGANVPIGWQVLHGEESLYFWGVSWIRPTAWVGNSILYSALVYMLFIFSYQYYLVKESGLAFLSSLLLAGAIYVAMSRYNLAATASMWLAVSLIWCIFYVNRARVAVRMCAVTLSAVVLMAALSFYNSLGIGTWSTKPSQPATERQSQSLSAQALKPEQYRNTLTASESTPIIFERFRASSPYSQGSNKMHVLETQRAIHQVLSGREVSGWGSQGISATRSIITDGLWFQFAIEVGVLNAALFMSWLLLIFVFTAFVIIKAYWHSRKARHISIDLYHTSFLYVAGFTILAYLAYALLGGIVNSSYACRITYALFWILIGSFMKSMDIWRAERNMRPEVCV